MRRAIGDRANTTTNRRQGAGPFRAAFLALKRARGVSLDRLSKQLDIPLRTMQRWASGVCIPSGEKLVRLLNACPDAETRALFLAAGGNGGGHSEFQIPNSESRATAGGGSHQGVGDMTPLSAEPAPSQESSETS